MKMLDGNSVVLSQHEALQDERQRSYDALEPKAKTLLREWVRDGETIGKPVRFAGSGFSPFVLADFIVDDPEMFGLRDAEFIAGVISANYLYAVGFAQGTADRAYDMWLTTPEASNALEDVISYLEQCELEDNDAS